MNRLIKLYDITLSLKELFDQPSTPKNRESIINEVTELIEQRGAEMEKINPPFSKEENEYGKKIVALNKHIQREMNELFIGLKKEMQHMKKQKKSKQSYSNPYQNVQLMDGMFLDSKQ